MAIQEYTVNLTQQVNTITFASEGPQGPTGVGAYAHMQGVPSATWTINHNLGFKPNITVVDSAGNIVEGAYDYVSNNQLIATFSGAFSGTAYLS